MAWADVERSRASWWVAGVVLGGVVLFVLYSFIGTFVFGLFFYYATRPLYRRISRHVRPPSLAALVSLFLLVLPIVILVVYALAIGLQELEQFTTSTDLGPYQSYIQPYLDVSAVVQDPSSILDDPDIRATIQATLENVLDYVGFVANALLHLFIMLVIAFYLLVDGPRLSRWGRKRFGDDRGVLLAYAKAVDGDLKNIFSGNILNALLTAGIGAIAYSVLNLFAPSGQSIPYPALMGLLTGAASLIPVVGMKLVYFPVTAYLLGAPYLAGIEPILWFPVVFFAVSFVIVDTIPDLVLRPYVSGRNLHLGMVMLAYIFGPLMFGWYGIFLGPILLVLVTHFVRIVLPELLEGQPIRPYAVDPSNVLDQGTEMDPATGGEDSSPADEPDVEGAGGG